MEKLRLRPGRSRRLRRRQRLNYSKRNERGNTREKEMTAKKGKELSPREREVHSLLATGCSNKEIAKALYITDQTVRNHIRFIFLKLGVDNRTRAALMYYQIPLIKMSEK